MAKKNLTMSDIMKIVQEEVDLVNGNGQRYGLPSSWVKKLEELGPETGHEAGTDPVEIMQKIVADLDEVSKHMAEMPSHVTASEFSGYFKSLSGELQAALDELLSGAK